MLPPPDPVGFPGVNPGPGTCGDLCVTTLTPHQACCLISTPVVELLSADSPTSSSSATRWPQVLMTFNDQWSQVPFTLVERSVARPHVTSHDGPHWPLPGRTIKKYTQYKYTYCYWLNSPGCYYTEASSYQVATRFLQYLQQCYHRNHYSPNQPKTPWVNSTP